MNIGQKGKNALRLKLLKCSHDFVRNVWVLVLPVHLSRPDAGKFVIIIHKLRHSMAVKTAGSGALCSGFESQLCHFLGI